MSINNAAKGQTSPRISISMDEEGDLKIISTRKRNELMYDRLAKVFPNQSSVIIFTTYTILLALQGNFLNSKKMNL
jgi:hypothetical protein